LLYPFNYGGI